MKRIVTALILLAATAFGQMTMQQRVDDFTTLSGMLNRNLAAYEWKKQLFGFDMLDIEPWLERVRAAKSDAEFFDICISYTASLNDYFTYLELPSDFEAYLGFTADLYEGKAIVESIDRVQLPTSRFAIAVGDEVISIDGRSVESLIAEYGKYVIDSNPQATRRGATESLTYRLQRYMPRAADVGVTSSVEIRRVDGSTVTLNLPWSTYGTPMRVGAVPDFTKRKAVSSRPYYERLMEQMEQGGIPRRAARTVDPETTETANPEIQSIGSVAPIFALPVGFQTRLGRGRTDLIYSGSYESGGKRIGFLRIPAFSTSTTFLTQLDTEIAWLQDNTDVLVLDQMRDQLVSLCGAERVAARFIGTTFRQPGFEIRARWANVLNFELALESALDAGADEPTINVLTAILKDLRTAYSENRGRTGPLPFCGTSMERPAAFDRNGKLIVYSKPILLVTDELSTDFFAAAVKDAGKAKQFGIRTRGSLGTSVALLGPAYSEMYVYIKDSIVTRAAPVKSEGYPESPYIENTGVHPEFVSDYMTMENYRLRGAPFVAAFTQAALSLVQ